MLWRWAPRGLSLAARLDALSIPEPNSGCWLWIGLRHKGYGRIRIGRRLSPAHRESYQLHRGAIPVTLELDHLCRLLHVLTRGI